MPVSLSEYVGVDPTVFAQTGAFDAILDVDSKLFIDPHLLQATTTPELSTSYSKVTKLFEELLQILSKSQNEEDVFWREAVRRFYFPELRGLCIGYSSKSTIGSGMGPRLRRQVLRTAKQIVDAGVDDHEVFELIGLFEEGIGPDRISDMVGRIIVEDLQNYTQRIFSELNVETKPIKNSPYQSVVNPFSRYAIILLPRDILRDLPIAESWEDIDYVCAYNRALRQRVNGIIGDTWKKATSVKKATLKDILINEPEVLVDLIESYRNKPAIKYDFENDPAGQVIWLAASRKYVNEFPLKLALPSEPSPEDVLQIVRTICDKFKDLVENNALSTLLYDTSGKAKKEEAAQKVFYGIADTYCEANNVDLSRETNAGRGPVDFKLSKGYRGRVIVEAKLTTNKQLLHGFETQIEEYKKAEKTQFGIYLVIDVTGGSALRVAVLKERINHAKALGLRSPEVIFVDAKPKKSASKF
jgi:hypothetical protein